MSLVKAGDEMRPLGRRRRQVRRRNQSPAQHGLLVFPVEQQDFHQSALHGLKQRFHFATPGAFGGIGLQPEPAEIFQVDHRRFETGKQIFSARGKIRRPVFRTAREGLVLAGGQRERLLAERQEGAEIGGRLRGKTGSRVRIHGVAELVMDKLATDAVSENEWVTAMAWSCQCMKPTRQRAISKSACKPGVAFVPTLASRATISL